MRAQALVKRYEDLAVLIDLEILPEPPVGRCSDCRDCAMNCFE
jgi:epoxyqueuosine reductase QueG